MWVFLLSSFPVCLLYVLGVLRTLLFVTLISGLTSTSLIVIRCDFHNKQSWPIVPLIHTSTIQPFVLLRGQGWVPGGPSAPTRHRIREARIWRTPQLLQSPNGHYRSGRRKDYPSRELRDRETSLLWRSRSTCDMCSGASRIRSQKVLSPTYSYCQYFQYVALGSSRGTR